MKARENSRRGEAPRGARLFRRKKALKGKSHERSGVK